MSTLLLFAPCITCILLFFVPCIFCTLLLFAPCIICTLLLFALHMYYLYYNFMYTLYFLYLAVICTLSYVYLAVTGLCHCQPFHFLNSSTYLSVFCVCVFFITLRSSDASSRYFVIQVVPSGDLKRQSHEIFDLLFFS